ncbi:MAG: helix-turn-helix domain-containing protein [Firmicutes bacterium]|nr:helix-turn-helix domain-containing protein [Bacillota bacterium]
MRINREKLTMAMVRACMNAADLEKESGLKRPTLNAAIGGRNVRPKTLGLISNALKVDPLDLLEKEA